MKIKISDNRFLGEIPRWWKDVTTWKNATTVTVSFSESRLDFVANNHEKILGFKKDVWSDFVDNVTLKKGLVSQVFKVFIARDRIYRGDPELGSIYLLDYNTMMYLLSSGSYWKVNVGKDYSRMKDICIHLSQEKINFLPFKTFILLPVPVDDSEFSFEYASEMLEVEKVTTSDPFLLKNLDL